MRRWKCKVCGYIHEGAEAPEKCPVCYADKSNFVEVDANGDEIAVDAPAEVKTGPTVVETPAVAAAPPAKSRGLLTRMVLGLHLHPISVHFPNGLLPASVVFLAIGTLLGIAGFSDAAFFNMVFVLATLPMVMATGYLEWQHRYQGSKTILFLVKIACSIVVLVSLVALVAWRFLDPQVADAASPNRLTFFGLALVMLTCAGIAGHLGGKLVFAGRNR